MVLIGLIVHLTAAVFLAIHVVGSHRSLYWLPLLLLVPLLASLVLPPCRLPAGTPVRATRAPTGGRGGQTAGAANATRGPADHAPAGPPELHRCPQPANRLRLAEALLADGAISEALRHYDDCLSGPFGDDATVRAGAARASAIIGRPLRVRDRRVAGNRPAGSSPRRNARPCSGDGWREIIAALRACRLRASPCPSPPPLPTKSPAGAPSPSFPTRTRARPR